MYPARLTGGPGPSGIKGTGTREHGLRATRNGEMKREKFEIWGQEPNTRKFCTALFKEKKNSWPLDYVLNEEETRHVKDMMSKYYYSPMKPHLVQDVWHANKDKIIEIKVTYHEIYGSSGGTRLEFWIKKPTYRDASTFGLVDGKLAGKDKDGNPFLMKTIDDPGEYRDFSVARCICFGGDGMKNESDYPKPAVLEALRHATAEEKIDWKKSQGYRAGRDPLKHAHHIEGKEFKTIYLKFLGAIKMSEEDFIKFIYPEHGNFETNHIVYSENGTGWGFKNTEKGREIGNAFNEFHYHNREYELIDPKPHAELTADEIKFNTSIRKKINEI